MSLTDPSKIPVTQAQVVKTFVCAGYASFWSAGTIDFAGKPLVNPTTDDYLSYLNNAASGSYALTILTSGTTNYLLLNKAFPAGNTMAGGRQRGPSPFGKQYDYEPMRLNMITAAGVNLTELWAIGDADEMASGELSGKPGEAKTPVHKNIREFGYFDGHVGSRKVVLDASGTTSHYDQ